MVDHYSIYWVPKIVASTFLGNTSPAWHCRDSYLIKYGVGSKHKFYSYLDGCNSVAIYHYLGEPPQLINQGLSIRGWHYDSDHSGLGLETAALRTVERRLCSRIGPNCRAQMPRKGGPNRVHIWELPLKIHQNGWNMLESIFYSKDPGKTIAGRKRHTEIWTLDRPKMGIQ